MALFADRVQETTTTTGTGNITLAGAATGYQTFNTAFGTSVEFFYGIFAGSEWETGIGHLSASTTLVRDGVLASSNSNAAVSFSAGTKTVINSIPAFATKPLYNYFSGLTLSNDGGVPNTKIDVAVGTAMDSTNLLLITLAAASTIDFTGTGAGKLDAGAIAASTWYHCYIISKYDGTTSTLASTSASAPSLPTGYIYFRRIGSVFTNGSSNLLTFTQFEDTFWWGTPVFDVNVSNLTTARTLYTLQIPLGAQTRPIIRATSTSGTASNRVLILSPAEPDSAPTSLGSSQPGWDLQYPSSGSVTGGAINPGSLYLYSNTSSQIAARADHASTSLFIMTRGYVDGRGKY